MNLVNHVAIIMDGNGRWGIKKRNSRNYGHREGLKTLEKIIFHSIKKKYEICLVSKIKKINSLIELIK